MARLLGFLLLVVIAVIGLSFAVLNADPVPLNYYFGFREIPLSMIIVVSLAIGALLGVLASLGLMVRLRRQLAAARRQLRHQGQPAAGETPAVAGSRKD